MIIGICLKFLIQFITSSVAARHLPLKGKAIFNIPLPKHFYYRYGYLLRVDIYKIKGCFIKRNSLIFISHG